MHRMRRQSGFAFVMVTAALALASASQAAKVLAPPPTLAVEPVPPGSGIPYKWDVGLSHKQHVEMVLFVGAKSWNEPSNPDGLKGWTHTSNWIAIDLEEDAKLKITVARQQGVVQSDGSGALTRDHLYPALSLYAGQDRTSDQDHVFNNSGDFWSTVHFMANEPNAKGRDKIVFKTKKLPAGQYTVDIGGNPPSLGDVANYPLDGCAATDPTCYAYTGQQGYHALIEAQ